MFLPVGKCGPFWTRKSLPLLADRGQPRSLLPTHQKEQYVKSLQAAAVAALRNHERIVLGKPFNMVIAINILRA